MITHIQTKTAIAKTQSLVLQPHADALTGNATRKLRLGKGAPGLNISLEGAIVSSARQSC